MYLISYETKDTFEYRWQQHQKSLATPWAQLYQHFSQETPVQGGETRFICNYRRYDIITRRLASLERKHYVELQMTNNSNKNANALFPFCNFFN